MAFEFHATPEMIKDAIRRTSIDENVALCVNDENGYYVGVPTNPTDVVVRGDVITNIVFIRGLLFEGPNDTGRTCRAYRPHMADRLARTVPGATSEGDSDAAGVTGMVNQLYNATQGSIALTQSRDGTLRVELLASVAEPGDVVMTSRFVQDFAKRYGSLADDGTVYEIIAHSTRQATCTDPTELCPDTLHTLCTIGCRGQDADLSYTPCSGFTLGPGDDEYRIVGSEAVYIRVINSPCPQHAFEALRVELSELVRNGPAGSVRAAHEAYAQANLSYELTSNAMRSAVELGDMRRLDAERRRLDHERLVAAVWVLYHRNKEERQDLVRGLWPLEQDHEKRAEKCMEDMRSGLPWF